MTQVELASIALEASWSLPRSEMRSWYEDQKQDLASSLLLVKIVVAAAALTIVVSQTKERRKKNQSSRLVGHQLPIPGETSFQVPKGARPVDFSSLLPTQAQWWNLIRSVLSL